MAASKKAVKKKISRRKVIKRKPSPEPKLITEIEDMWDDEENETWGNLNPRQQKFFIAYLNNNFNSAGAYKTAYNPKASNEVAASCGFRMLINADIQTLCGNLTRTRKSDLLLIQKTLYCAMKAENIAGQPDHSIRRMAAMDLAKLNGELSEKSKQDNSGNTAVVHYYGLPRMEDH